MLTDLLSTRLQALIGGPVARRMARYRLWVGEIAGFEPGLRAESDAQLKERCLSLRYRARSGERLQRMLPETYALVREAAQRTVGLRHFDVQLLGGMAMFDGAVAEMQTGEGKTLTATLPLVLRGLSAQGAWLATANDYLARRDAEWMGPIYHLLGLTAGVVLTGMSREARRAAYACDVIYGTAREFGFDFLRDRLAQRDGGQPLAWLADAADGDTHGARGPAAPSLPGQPLDGPTGQVRAGTLDLPVQRLPHAIVVDEADSLLIDEARTPLIISGSIDQGEDAAALYEWAAGHASEFSEQDFELEEQTGAILLTASGRDKVRSLKIPQTLRVPGIPVLYEQIERALAARRNFQRDRQYIVRDGEVVIVDEFTGRLGEGRRWQAGLHQAIEAKEGVPITSDLGHVARVTVQDFFVRFSHVAGMTGTARASAREFRKCYRLQVVPIPTQAPARWQRLPDSIHATGAEKWAAIVEEVVRVHATGQPVLIGVRSIERSEQLSGQLTRAGIAPAVLNAVHPAEEAAIIARAGETGKVTVATNMAGRGTDIKLGGGVAELGGLFVIGTEMHESARIDRQLAGRCGRQGDPGSFRQFVSLDDELLQTAFGPQRAARMARAESILLTRNPAVQMPRLSRLFQHAQRIVERRHYRDRVVLQYTEHRRQQMLAALGLDPYLDAPD